ncbi:riboflavin-specific deaminase-like protein [Palleronia aestuarii]|uniref:Riboflavin-specific deaminase-like protein n=1 Tax=Palleronia aestuarii TaxID=568105 RepID=A0A2W7NCV4_9RHOB|nr:RibD family protein [Palleronia aestuarii]PZX18211.1 riboflavin-specific deaminase-like protein [Palleronia aestuarii]
MSETEVTPQVWDRLLAIRQGTACNCCGNWTAGERAALRLYAPLARRDLGPVAVGQIGQSLDGRVATVAGDARDVSGKDGLAHLHRMRALVDGVIIGIRTVLHDSPRLTVRLCEGRNPARIVIDPRGRLPEDAPVLRDDGSRRIVVQSVDRTWPAGITVIRLPSNDGQIDPGEIMTALRSDGLQNLLVEGGGLTIAGFLEAGLLSRLQVAISPLLIGAGPQGLTLQNPAEKLSDAIRPSMQTFLLGSDVVFDCGLVPEAMQATRPMHPATDSWKLEARR